VLDEWLRHTVTSRWSPNILPDVEADHRQSRHLGHPLALIDALLLTAAAFEG
jgi:hypothetical protein